MGIIELLLLAVSLSMDAFAVSICKGLASDRVTAWQTCKVGLWFGGFQALMPAIGFFLGSTFEQYITAFDHWIAFILLALIGANMVKESRSQEAESTDASVAWRAMLPLAVATSIDALAVGVTFAFLIDSMAYLAFALALIGVTTFVISVIGVRVGRLVGARFQARAEFAGGVVLILIGLKILLEHLGVLG
jgi:putative Mn2+ efflux pump MntP